MNFIYDYKCVKENYPPAYWFIFYKDEILTVEKGDRLEIPFIRDIRELGMPLENMEYIGSLDGKDCYTASTKDNEIMPGFALHRLLPAFEQLEEEWFWIAGRAFHLLSWIQKARYCSVCGSKLAAAQEERARHCNACGNRVYPRISPAIIVAVTHGDKILLARGTGFTSPMHSVIAGFVEPGETLEDCVRREVKEEVGIEVKNVRYFGNQPWPFPDSLMVAFTAEYASGTITIDPKEIGEANWYSVHDLPQIPRKISVARKMIDWFQNEYKG